VALVAMQAPSRQAEVAVQAFPSSQSTVFTV
jgi:hypothetical protein